MIDLELLKAGARSALPTALGKALVRFMRDHHLSTRDAGERLGIVHTNLVKSRIFKLSGADVLKPLARCEDAEICILAQALLERLEIPLSDFDFETVAWQLQAGAGLNGLMARMLHEPIAADATHRAAVDDLLYCFVRGAFYGQLAAVRMTGLRCTPAFPTGRLLETGYCFDPGEDPASYTDDNEFGGYQATGRFVEEDTFETQRIRGDLTTRYLELAHHENLFLLEAIENAAAFHQTNGESQDDLTAASAAVQACICYESMFAASATLRSNMMQERLLARTPLARIAMAIHEHSRSNIDQVGTMCESALAALPPERERARAGLLSHLKAGLGSIKARPTVTEA